MKKSIVSAFTLVLIMIGTNLKAEEILPGEDEGSGQLLQWCTAGTITTTTCPNGVVVNSGMIIVVFNCETGNIFSITTVNYADYSQYPEVAPLICQGNGGGIVNGSN